MRPAQCVLIVEDSYLLLEIIASLCETHGIRVIEASTGEAALTVLRDRGDAIDWLFTDIHLPGLIDGWTVPMPSGRSIRTVRWSTPRRTRTAAAACRAACSCASPSRCRRSTGWSG